MDNVLVTGSSTGLGLETALYLARRGFRVFAGVRDLGHRPTVLEAAGERGVELTVVQLDVTDSQSVDRAVETIVESGGGVYGLVNNAGIGLRGCFEDLQMCEIRDVFEANVFGTMNVTRRVLPHMRAAGRGRIVTISSVGGRIATFGLSAYISTKFAQEGFGEALALEVQPFGIRSILIEPGIIKTSRWSVNRGNAAHALDPASPYHAMFVNHEALADRFVETRKTRPHHVAKAVHRALTSRWPRMRYVVGRPASVAIALRGLMPDRVFDWLYFGTLLRHIKNDQAAGPAAHPRDPELGASVAASRNRAASGAMAEATYDQIESE
ncbi:SDR family oxidoreductase [Paludisphaera borealis]|uniref:3-alpha-(Or 20-beta)-hydroxysteroid dehydrogenase n=1 Tax=Paludisphaera borealis TaxID=1387353 RepID=A0A1U7CTS3_9BACT|nr:SDR family oxidoreductase [Paludisphaera borealis]APW62350.1 3-alpha-(or 20-beta)-hydroxysteroid dehydrogenase [Paludisphaera borealis]